MNKPILILNGVSHDFVEPKAKIWRQISEFDQNKLSLSNADFIDKHAEFIADFFNVSVDDVLEYVDISDITKIFFDCHKFTSELIYSKLRELDSTKDASTTEAS